MGCRMKPKGKIEEYLESRLWKHKIRGIEQPIGTEKLLDEIQRFFFVGKEIDPALEKSLVVRIRKARKKVRNRWHYLQRKYPLWAKQLGIDAKSVEKLYLKGFIKNQSDINRLAELLWIVRHG